MHFGHCVSDPSNLGQRVLHAAWKLQWIAAQPGVSAGRALFGFRCGSKVAFAVQGKMVSKQIPYAMHVPVLPGVAPLDSRGSVSYTHLRAHETSAHL
eukprot:10537563-Alexandrium_andersonii.AAC.1